MHDDKSNRAGQTFVLLVQFFSPQDYDSLARRQLGQAGRNGTESSTQKRNDTECLPVEIRVTHIGGQRGTLFLSRSGNLVLAPILVNLVVFIHAGIGTLDIRWKLEGIAGCSENLEGQRGGGSRH